jgi:hypothetical protein
MRDLKEDLEFWQACKGLQAETAYVTPFIDVINNIVPEAIERAIAAEELVTRLQNELVKSTAQDEEWHCEFSELREVCDHQRYSIQQLSAQVVEAQSDNASILKAYQETIRHFEEDGRVSCDWNVLESAHPGADIRERMEKLEAVAKEAEKATNNLKIDRHCNYVVAPTSLSKLLDALAALEGGTKIGYTSNHQENGR